VLWTSGFNGATPGGVEKPITNLVNATTPVVASMGPRRGAWKNTDAAARSRSFSESKGPPPVSISSSSTE
jgi:hypothetical protein